MRPLAFPAMLAALMLSILFSLSCVAAQIDYEQVYFEITPSQPNDSTPVNIEAWTWFPDPGEELVSASYLRNGYQIDMEVLLQEKPSYIPVMTPCGGSVDCGILSAGFYDVTADIWLIPWDSETPEFYCSGSTSFTVTPEPSTFILLVMGVAGLLVFIQRQRNER